MIQANHHFIKIILFTKIIIYIYYYFVWAYFFLWVCTHVLKDIHVHVCICM